uniref:Uncharacterized protein n=1 Tax=Globisporangium ultimum (strain ATCC 200006 / CBS 805.95 / DAOM BR144) TaxID=431595 RepID=K3X1K9_GLOUD
MIPDCDPFDEDKFTKKFMLEYGIDNVRGGSYSRVKLLLSEYEAISQQLHGSTDQCFGPFCKSLPVSDNLV